MSFQVRSQCPGALVPMQTGDGLLVRLKPSLGCLSSSQCTAIGRLARTYGNGALDLTTRANLQIRGVRPDDHASLIESLRKLALLDPNALVESRRNILLSPFAGAVGRRQALALEAGLAQSTLALPAKFGFAIDTGEQPVLQRESADIRIERACGAGYLVRADGEALGIAVDELAIIPTALALAEWFVQASARAADSPKRMAALIARGLSPGGSLRGSEKPAPARHPPLPGDHTTQGQFVGAEFGQLSAETFQALAPFAPLYLTPWRMLLLTSGRTDAASKADSHGHGSATSVPDLRQVVESYSDLIITPSDPRLRVLACVGAPACNQALQATRPLARTLARTLTETQETVKALHVSGCAKGCASRAAADVTLVGTAGGFDVVLNGNTLATPHYHDLPASSQELTAWLANARTDKLCSSDNASHSQQTRRQNRQCCNPWLRAQHLRDSRKAHESVKSQPFQAQGIEHRLPTEPSSAARHKAVPLVTDTPPSADKPETKQGMARSYERNGAAIYRESFRTIRSEANLARFSPEEEAVVVRMIHAAGLVELAHSVHFHSDFVLRARHALDSGAAILCDTHMVAEGITRARLPRGNEIICTLRDERVPGLAESLATTRSAAALELWRDRLDGALVAIGNAPTALFHLLDMLDDRHCPRPAAIIGCPVGFVGAAESKQDLLDNTTIPRLAVAGRLGGSAITVAAVNAVASRSE